MEIDRPRYLEDLILHKHDGRIKILTGIRRCGKSYLLNTIFYRHLIACGTDASHIIRIAFDSPFDLEKMGVDFSDIAVRKDGVDPHLFMQYLSSLLTDSEQYYLLLDEVQMMRGFDLILTGLLKYDNLDVYVTGSNSRFLSTDVATEFAGRGVEIHVFPLSFSEFFAFHANDNLHEDRLIEEYLMYGGLPAVVLAPTVRQKLLYLKTEAKSVYLRDIIQRYHLQSEKNLENLVSVLASTTASYVNPARLSHTLASVRHIQISPNTIDRYISYLADAFLIAKSIRYDVRGNRYTDTPYKLYFEDTGVRNILLDFRQTDIPALMETAVFNELRYRGYSVDVGLVVVRELNTEKKQVQKQLEIDFVANFGSSRYYIQSSMDMPTPEKRRQELHSFDAVHDSFRKITVVGGYRTPTRDEKGYVTMGLLNFLLNPENMNV